MKIAYVIDEPLLTSTASANQVVQTAAALGHAGVDVTLMVPVRRGEQLDPVQVERHYGPMLTGEPGPLRRVGRPPRLTAEP